MPLPAGPWSLSWLGSSAAYPDAGALPGFFREQSDDFYVLGGGLLTYTIPPLVVGGSNSSMGWEEEPTDVARIRRLAFGMRVEGAAFQGAFALIEIKDADNQGLFFSLEAGAFNTYPDGTFATYAPSYPGAVTAIDLSVEHDFLVELGETDWSLYVDGSLFYTGSKLNLGGFAGNPRLDLAWNVAYPDDEDNGLIELSYLAVDYEPFPAPTVTINQHPDQPDPAHLPPVYFSVVFDEDVSGFGDSDVDLSASTCGGTLTASVSGFGMYYQVDVEGMTTPGDVIAILPAGAAVSSDTGVPSAASTSTDNVVEWEPPTDSGWFVGRVRWPEPGVG